jgi:RNA polymerase sigma factor (sigma-70 family)
MKSKFSELDEKALFSRYAKGDEAAFRVFYERVSPKIWSFVRKRISSLTEAEEIYQEAWTKIHRFRDRYDPDLEPLPWVYTITRSVLTDRMRAVSAVPETAFDPSSLEQKSNSLVEVEPRNDGARTEELEQVLSALPEDQRELLQKRYDQDLSFEQIATGFGVREETIRKRLSRILQKIRRSV